MALMQFITMLNSVILADEGEVSTWILATGFWNDDGFWDDNENWID